MNDLRPQGTVVRECEICHWQSWHDPLSAEATAIPFVCTACRTNPTIGFTCTACNRQSAKSHRELTAEYGEHTHHCAACLAEGVAYRSFAKTVYCAGFAKDAQNPTERCGNLATQIKRWPKHCDCPACWQTFYHLCDDCAAEWMYDLPAAEQKAIMRARGAIVTDYPDGSWSSRWPVLTFKTN